MDMPENCGACVLRDKCGVLYFGSRYVDYTERDPDCPLKSTDEILSVIKPEQNLPQHYAADIHQCKGFE